MSTKHTESVPDPVAIVEAHPNPFAILREYVESASALKLATEHERRVRVLTAEGAEVSDPVSYAAVGERLKEAAAYRIEVERWFEPLVSFAHRLHKMICDRRTAVLAPLVAFERTAKANRLALERKEERERREREQALAEEARREEQARLEREAAHLEQRGEPELAAQVLEAAIVVAPPVIELARTLPKTAGVSTRANWRWRPLGGDTPEARARAERLVPREFLELSDRKLTAHAKANGASARVPGIEFYDAGSVVVR